MTEAPGKPSDQPCRREDAAAVVAALRDRGHVAFFAGGCVRDELLGLQPKDFDIATDATPDQVRSIFARTQSVGAAFGVTLVRQGPSTVEVATFRTDEDYSDGRRPDAVRFTNAQEDAQRRDFTINGLFFDPIENRVIDYVGGQADLSARTLRAIGDPARRFGEDYLRMLRAARFAARFDLAIEPATYQAIIDHAPRLARITPERIHDELLRMLTPPTRGRAWPLLWRLRLLPVIFRGLSEQPAAPPATMFFPLVAPDRTISFALAMAAAGLCYCMASGRSLTVLLTPEPTRRLISACRRALRTSNDDTDAMRQILSIGELLHDPPPRLALLKRSLARPHSGDARLLMAACGQVEAVFAQRAAALEEQFKELEKTQFAPPPLITGDDLIAAGLQPGPAFKRVLDFVYDAQLEGRLNSREDALKTAIEMFESFTRPST